MGRLLRARPRSPESRRGVGCRIDIEHPVRVERRVEVVRRLRLPEPEVPDGIQLGLRQITQVEVLLAQEFVPLSGHGAPAGAGSKGRTPSAREVTMALASRSGRPSISR